MSYFYFYTYEVVSRLSFIYQYVNFLKTGEATEKSKRKLLKILLKNITFENAVETGTYLGKSTRIFSKHIKNVYSIEIKKELYNFVKRKYAKSKINFVFGMSEQVLKKIVLQIRGSTFFYLDSHYSGGITSRGKKVTSLNDELLTLDKFLFLLNSVIIIDDAKSINGTNDYPKFQVIKDFADQNNMKIYKTKVNSYILIGSKIGELPERIRKHLITL